VFPDTRTNGFAPLTDWQLVARPPLVLENQLPVPGTFLVWEQPKVCYVISCDLSIQTLMIFQCLLHPWMPTLHSVYYANEPRQEARARQLHPALRRRADPWCCGRAGSWPPAALCTSTAQTCGGRCGHDLAAGRMCPRCCVEAFLILLEIHPRLMRI